MVSFVQISRNKEYRLQASLTRYWDSVAGWEVMGLSAEKTSILCEAGKGICPGVERGQRKTDSGSGHEEAFWSGE